MAEILLSNRSISTAQLEQQCNVNPDDIYSKSKTQGVFANQPYLVGKQPTHTELAILHTLRNAQKNQQLTEVALSLGEDGTIAVAEMMKKLQENPSAIVGAATGAYSARASGFQGAVQKYQQALMQYRNTMTSSAAKASQQGAKQAALRAYKDMQHKFQLEMGVITNHTKARKGTALTNPTRATNLARSGRNAAKLDVTSQAQAHDLVNFSNRVQNLGNGLIVYDFTKRIGKIRNSYQAGKNWEREMFIESSSFVASTIAGSTVAYSLSFLVLSTPLGWVGLIAGGVILTGISASASIYADNITKNNSGALYDQIMHELSSK